MEHKEKISSNWTFFYKFILAPISIIGAFIPFIASISMESSFKYYIPIISFAISVYIWHGLARLKYVIIENGYLIISNYIKIQKVSLLDIENITVSYLYGIRPIFIVFKNKTIFGKKVMFAPKHIWLHRTFRYLNELIEEIRGS